MSECIDCGAPDPKYPVARLCNRCYLRRWRVDKPGYNTEAKRRWRQDPVNAERDREFSRRWKREHLGQPGQRRAAV